MSLAPQHLQFAAALLTGNKRKISGQVSHLNSPKNCLPVLFTSGTLIYGNPTCKKARNIEELTCRELLKIQRKGDEIKTK